VGRIHLHPLIGPGLLISLGGQRLFVGDGPGTSLDPKAMNRRRGDWPLSASMVPAKSESKRSVSVELSERMKASSAGARRQLRGTTINPSLAAAKRISTNSRQL
jgi:hypothetical protein